MHFSSTQSTHHKPTISSKWTWSNDNFFVFKDKASQLYDAMIKFTNVHINKVVMMEGRQKKSGDVNNRVI